MPVQLKPELEDRLQHLAACTSRTPDELAEEGLERFIAYEEDLLMAVKRGNEDIAAGRVLEHEAVVARIEKLLQGR
jgi:predicted transcriptional regulator